MTYLKKNISNAFLFIHHLKNIEVTAWDINGNHSLLNQGIQRQKR
ncbi:hypothetical protein ACOYR1_14285 [Thalassotalea piscium]